MKYTAPDGHVIISNPDTPVVYTCPVSDMVEGTFFSLETKSAPTSIGIQQIQITRVISEDSIAITIKESSSEELIAYQAEVDGGGAANEEIINLLNQ